MFTIQKLINKPFEIYSEEVSESFEMLSPKREFLARNIGKYNLPDDICSAGVLWAIIFMGNGPHRLLLMGLNTMSTLIKTDMRSICRTTFVMLCKGPRWPKEALRHILTNISCIAIFYCIKNS